MMLLQKILQEEIRTAIIHHYIRSVETPYWPHRPHRPIYMGTTTVHHTGRSSQLPMVSELRCTTRKNTNDLARGRLGMGRNAKTMSRCLVNVAPFVRVVRVVRINKCLPRALYSFRGRNYFRMAGKDGRCSVVGPIYGPVRSG